MIKTYLFLAEGFEETEALTTVDILRRAGVDCLMVSLTGHYEVTGSHNISVKADKLFEEAAAEPAEAFVLPGGPGHKSYFAHQGLTDLLQRYFSQGKLVAAICAAPVYLGSLGLLKGKTAVCFPDMEEGLEGGRVGCEIVEKDGNVITSIGPGTTPFFALAIVESLVGPGEAEKVKQAFQLHRLL